MKDIESNGETIINSKSENSINEEKQIDKYLMKILLKSSFLRKDN